MSWKRSFLLNSLTSFSPAKPTFLADFFKLDSSNSEKILTVIQEAEINQFCHFPETSDDDFRLTTCNDLIRFCFVLDFNPATSNILNFAIWQKKHWPSKSLLKQEAEINQICHLAFSRNIWRRRSWQTATILQDFFCVLLKLPFPASYFNSAASNLFSFAIWQKKYWPLNRKRKLINFAIFQKHLMTTKLTTCND